MASKKLLDSIEKKGESIKNSAKNSNLIVDLFKLTNSNKKLVKIKSVETLSKVFGELLKKKRLILFSEAEIETIEKSEKKLSAEEKLRKWIFERYVDFKDLLVRSFEAKDEDGFKAACLTAGFELIKNETRLKSETSSEEDGEKKAAFPFEFFHSLIDSVLNEGELGEKLIKKLKHFLNFADLRFFFLKHLLIEFLPTLKANDELMKNLLSVFVLVPKLAQEESKPTKIANDKNLELNEEEQKNEEEIEKKKKKKKKPKKKLSVNSKICQIGIHRKMFNDCVVLYLRNQIKPSLYRKLLVKLPEKILPKMSNPLMLADFLTQSYNTGGLISVLALNSLFILITRYNLEYPNFYQKVYQLLDCAIFGTKYKDRFFQLLDTFLLSTHLSSALIGAFVKKLSRMSLNSPPGDLRFLILFVFNLLIRHQNCKVLIHRNKSAQSIRDDPFDVNCTDFAKCNALKSSLWEIQSLKSHYLCHVSKEVEKLNSLNTKIEFQLDEVFENNSYEDLIGQELDDTKGTANCALNYNQKNIDETVSNLLKFF